MCCAGAAVGRAFLWDTRLLEAGLTGTGAAISSAARNLLFLLHYPCHPDRRDLPGAMGPLGAQRGICRDAGLMDTGLGGTGVSISSEARNLFSTITALVIPSAARDLLGHRTVGCWILDEGAMEWSLPAQRGICWDAGQLDAGRWGTDASVVTRLSRNIHQDYLSFHFDIQFHGSNSIIVSKQSMNHHG